MKKSLLADLPTQGNPRWDESIGFRSMHTGGCQILRGDCSLIFFSESIDGVTNRALASRAGGNELKFDIAP